MIVSYTVFTTFADPQLAEQWLRWLREGHIAEVMRGGARDAEIVELDPVPAPGAGPQGTRAFEVRYHFHSRESFIAYERDHASRLRAEGLKLFPVERGISYRRATGNVIETFSATAE